MREQLKEQLKTALNKHKDVVIKCDYELGNNHVADFILFYKEKPHVIGDFSSTKIENHKNPNLMTYLNHDKIVGNNTDSEYWMIYDGNTIAINDIRMDLPRDHFYGKESTAKKTIVKLFQTIFSDNWEERRLW